MSRACAIGTLVLVALASSDVAARPPVATDEQIATSIERGVRFLLESQNEDGSWGSPRGTKGLNIYAPVPGAHHAFLSGVTGLCTSALAGHAPVSGERPEVDAALSRAERWLLEELPIVRRATPDAIYNVWGHAYCIEALVALIRREPEREERNGRLRDAIGEQIDRLARYEVVDGGWAYYDFDVGSQTPAGSSISFTTATVLIALDAARDVGIEAPERVVRRAIASIRRQQKPDFSYLYGEYLKWRPMRGINRPGGSLGRSQVCNAALRMWGSERITDAVLESWLARLLDRNLWLDIGRKRPVPHEAWFQVAGYFFYYGHHYAGVCLQLLPEAQREPYRGRLAEVIIARQEKDGSWWDFPLYSYHRPYGTAFALMTLQACTVQEREDAADASVPLEEERDDEKRGDRSKGAEEEEGRESAGDHDGDLKEL